jgi:ABC-type multidrug transport system fused ATPase/permease subunit
MQEMTSISISMAGIFTVGAVATFMHTAVLETVGQKVGARLRKQLFDHILAQDAAFHGKSVTF